MDELRHLGAILLIRWGSVENGDGAPINRCEAQPGPQNRGGIMKYMVIIYGNKDL
jgi:hypothetical protein